MERDFKHLSGWALRQFRYSDGKVTQKRSSIFSGNVKSGYRWESWHWLTSCSMRNRLLVQKIDHLIGIVILTWRDVSMGRFMPKVIWINNNPSWTWIADSVCELRLITWSSSSCSNFQEALFHWQNLVIRQQRELFLRWFSKCCNEKLPSMRSLHLSILRSECQSFRLRAGYCRGHLFLFCFVLKACICVVHSGLCSSMEEASQKHFACSLIVGSLHPQW